MTTKFVTINDIDPENPVEVEIFETAMGDSPETDKEVLDLHIEEVCDKLNESIGEFLEFGSVGDLLEFVGSYLNAIGEDEATIDDGLPKN